MTTIESDFVELLRTHSRRYHDQHPFRRRFGERHRYRLVTACDRLNGIEEHVVLLAARGAALRLFANHAQRVVKLGQLQLACEITAGIRGMAI